MAVTPPDVIGDSKDFRTPLRFKQLCAAPAQEFVQISGKAIFVSLEMFLDAFGLRIGCKLLEDRGRLTGEDVNLESLKGFVLRYHFLAPFDPAFVEWHKVVVGKLVVVVKVKL
jgi:hypothetical protein